MFYSSWRLFPQEKFLSPKGPNFNHSVVKVMAFDGVRISMQVPKHSPSVQVNAINPARQYDLTDEYGMDLFEENGFQYRSQLVLTRNWAFYGPWFTGDLGSIQMTSLILKPLTNMKGVNLYHPRVCEAVIADFLTAHYGKDFSLNEVPDQCYFAPTNWRPINGQPGKGVRFDVCPNPNTLTQGVKCYFVAPISTQYLFIVHCDISRSGVFTDISPKPLIDEWIDHEPFLKLANQVLDSVQIKLSPEAEAAQQEALQGLSEADKQLVKDFPPLKWTKSDLVAS